MEQRILLVEDEKTLLDAIKFNLEQEGYEVITAENGMDAVKKFKGQRFNLVILDIMIPELDGFAVCEKIRLENTDTPILFLTAKDSAADKIKGFKIGADDYITKPFNLEEALLRVQVLVRHSLKGTEEESALKKYKFGENEINFVTYDAKGPSGDLKLTKKEAMLLKLLIDHKNVPVSREQILQYVWGYDVYPSTRTIDNFILSFRKYFEEDFSHPEYFQSIRGVGYMFTIKA